MYYSILVEFSEGTGKNKRIFPIILTNQTSLEKIKIEIVTPYLKHDDFFMDGYRLNESKISRMKITSSEKSIKKLVDEKNQERRAKNRHSDVVVLFSSYNSLDILRDRNLVCDITTDTLKEVQKELQHSKLGSQKMKKFAGDNNRVFIVHGHNDKIKLDVSNFLRKLGLEPVILHEQTNQGKIIIEKIEANTNVGYGIVIYTPCDKGGTVDDVAQGNTRFRARQNVIFEHGYLIGKLGRDKVCALVEGNIERPSDIDGVVYIQYQSGWELVVGRELKIAGYDADLNKL